MREKDNVVKIEDLKARKEVHLSRQSYGKYLKSLDNFQLEIEVNHLIKIASEKKTPDDLYVKGKMVLKEISSRVSPLAKAKLHKLYSMHME